MIYQTVGRQFVLLEDTNMKNYDFEQISNIKDTNIKIQSWRIIIIDDMLNIMDMECIAGTHKHKNDDHRWYVEQ